MVVVIHGSGPRASGHPTETCWSSRLSVPTAMFGLSIERWAFGKPARPLGPATMSRSAAQSAAPCSGRAAGGQGTDLKLDATPPHHLNDDHPVVVIPS